jgi:transposase
LLLSPLVRRTLAPKGKTPQLIVSGQRRQKVSVISALTLSPRRGRLGLYFRTIPKGSFNGESVAAFVRQLLRHLRGRVIVVWDRWSAHRGSAIQTVLADHPRLELAYLPAYAPELNPVEYLWSHLKWSELCNFVPQDADDLDRAIGPTLRKTTQIRPLLLGFWQAAKLSMPQRCLC